MRPHLPSVYSRLSRLRKTFLHSRSLSDIDLSTAANDPRPSASCSARKNPQRILANTPPGFPGLRPRIWPHLLRLATKVMPDRLLELRTRQVGRASRMKVDLVHLVCLVYLVQPNKRDRPDTQERPAILELHAPRSMDYGEPASTKGIKPLPHRE